MIADSKSFQTPTKLVSKRAKIKVKMKQQQHDIKCKENSEKIRAPDEIWTHDPP